jgi:hypothetical protein
MKIVKKIVKVLVILIVAALVVIQFFQIDKVNPPVVAAETLQTAVTVPQNVQMILDRSCSDCHTNTTVYPWYSNIQPVGWFLKNHINDGRREVNFSIFNTYTGKRRIKKLEEICEQVDSKEMPLPSYLWIHRDQMMRDGDAKILCDWTNSEKAKIAE